MVSVQAAQSTTPGIEIRPYQGTESDLAAITQIRNETLRATTLPEDYEEFTSGAMEAYYERAGLSLAGNAWLLFAEGEATGAAILFPAAASPDGQLANFHLYVVPARWRHGLGSVLLSHLEYQAAARGYPVLETAIAAEDSRSAHFLKERGFLVVGHSHHLARHVDVAIPEVSFPAGFVVRSLEDLGAGPDFYIETDNRLGAYDAGYTLVTTEALQIQEERALFQPAGIFLLFDTSGRIVGLIRGSLEQGTRRAWLNEVRLEPASRGKGLGRALVATALAHLQEQGATRVELDTAGENVAAYNLARRTGFTEARHWLHLLKRLPALPYEEDGATSPAKD